MKPRHPQLPGLEWADDFLMWVGRKYYPTPTHFLQECHTLGLSKRIPLIPRGLRLHKSKLFLLHPACPINKHLDPPPTIPGCFAWAVITSIQIVIADDTDPQVLKDTMRALGIEVDPIPLSQAAREPKRGCGFRTSPGSIYLVTKGSLADIQSLASEKELSGRVSPIQPPIPYYGKRFRGIKHLNTPRTATDVHRWRTITADIARSLTSH